METQSVLHARSDEIPEGLYLELMNKLKIDFTNEKKHTIIVINKNIAKTVLMSKSELHQQIIKSSVSWEDREEVLLKLPGMSYWRMKDFATERKLLFMKVNKRWKEQERIIEANRLTREFFIQKSPAVLNM